MEIHHSRRRVTLHMGRFDGALVALLLGRPLPVEFAVWVSGAGQSAGSLARRDLVVALVGSNHAARAQRLVNGDFGVRPPAPVSSPSMPHSLSRGRCPLSEASRHAPLAAIHKVRCEAMKASA